MPSVAMKGGTLITDTTKPLMAPAMNPTTTPATIASQI